MKWPFIAVLKLLRRMLKHIVGVHQQKFFCCQLAEGNQLCTAAPASVAILVNIAPNIPKPQEPEKGKTDQKKQKPEKKPAKKKEKQSEDSMQLSLEGWF